MKIRRFVLKAEHAIDRLLGVYNNRLPSTKYIPLEDLGRQFGLEIITDSCSEDEDIQFDRPSATQVRIYARLLAGELAIYPAQILKDSNIERLVLCTNLRSRQHKVSGLTDMGLFKIDTLYLDLSHAEKNWNFSRRTFHHELFHAIDFSDSLEGYVDTEWRKLNSEDYKYFATEENFRAVEVATAGFITAYSTRSAIEDKAELYSFMVTDFQRVQNRCLSDAVLARKVERMKALLRSFSAHYDDVFWDKMHARADQIARIKHK
ncbi:MAG TPA: putative zinc-binding metallopeptidase [Drouetiella sp.]